jgi:hypothetical protein
MTRLTGILIAACVLQSLACGGGAARDRHDGAAPPPGTSGDGVRLTASN